MAAIGEISEKATAFLGSKDNIKGDITVEEKRTQEITMKDGKFTLFRTLFDNSISIKVIKDHRLGRVSLNECTEEAVRAGIDDAIASAESGSSDDNYDIAPGLEAAYFKTGVLEPDIDRLMERTRELSDDIAGKHPNIKLIEMFAKYVRGHAVFTNTNGTRDEKDYGYYEIMTEFAGSDGDATSGISGAVVVTDNLDAPFITLGDIEQNLTDAENSIHPITINDKFEGDVIFTPGCASQLLMYLFMNTVADRVLIDGTSKWKDSIGQQVASELLTVSSKPWDERIVDHEVHTVDGFRSEDYSVIEKGVLKSFAAGLYTANKCGVKRAGNSATDLVVEAGDTAYADMIKSIKKGLIVGMLSCGLPGANGEIAGVAKNAFYVENGEIRGAVIGTMISGNLMDMFSSVKAVSKEQVIDGTMVMPYIQVGGITVSGT